MNYGRIIKREIDNSYVINNGMYHVATVQSFLNEGYSHSEARTKANEYAQLYADVDAYAQANPDKVTIEPIPEPEPEEGEE